MVQDILDLPPELTHQIYKYFYVCDLRNLACCSKSHYESVKYVLYNIVCIPWKIVETESFHEEQLENLKFTSSLRFTDYGSLEQIMWDKLSKNYEQILAYTDPNILINVEINNNLIINDKNMEKFTLPISLEEISLVKCYDLRLTEWYLIGCICCLKTLTITQCIIDDAGIECIANASTLCELTLIKCSKITEESLLYLAKLTKLQKIKIKDCHNIVGDGYIYLGGLSSINELVLIDIHLTEYSMAAFTKLKCLKILYINCYHGNSYNGGDAGLSYITGLSSLEKLCINWKCVTDKGCSDLTNLCTLKHLNISGCVKIGEIGLLHISKLTMLTQLNISNCEDLTDIAINHIKNLKSLKMLDISGCVLLTDISVYHLRKLKLLQKFYLRHCTHITDIGMEYASLLASLCLLDVSGCFRITDLSLLYTSPLGFLEVFRLMDCTKITDIGLSYLESLTSLKYLDVSLDNYNRQTGCMQVNDFGLLYISTIRSLSYLNVSSCDYVTDYGLSHIGKLKSLKILKLSCCIKITDPGLLNLSSLSLLRFLDISMCIKVTDVGVDYICKLISLKKLDLHGCKKVTKPWSSLHKHILFKYHGHHGI